MAEVPKQLSLEKAPAVCECVIFGNGQLWFKSEQEVWPAWLQWKLMPASGSSCRSGLLLLVRAGLAMQRGGLMLKHHWEGCLMTRLQEKKDPGMAVTQEQWVLFLLFIAFPERVCGYWLCGHGGWFIFLSIFSRCFSKCTLKRKEKKNHPQTSDWYSVNREESPLLSLLCLWELLAILNILFENISV